MPKEKSSVSQCLLVLCLLLFVVTVDFAISPLILAQNTILITDYGASPNDDSDDTLAIQSAITNAQPGDTVLIPAGTFHVSASIIMGNSNVKLLGESQAGSILKPIGTTFINPIVLSGASNSVKDFTIDGMGTTGFANAIIVGGTGATVDHITIKDLNTFGFQHGIYALQANDVTVSNSTFENIHVNSTFGAAIRFQSGNGASFFGNTIRNTGRGGIFINELNGVGSTDILIHDNVIENSGLAPGGIAMGIELGPFTQRAAVEDNRVDHWISVGPVVDQAAIRRNTIGDTRQVPVSYGLESAGGGTNLVFSNNIVTDGIQIGLLVANVNTKEHMLFRNNLLQGATDFGMLIQGDPPPITTSYYYQNEIANNNGPGVRILREVNHVTFDSNVIRDNSGHGIRLEDNASDQLSFVNNQILNNSGSSVSGNFLGSDLEWSNNTVSGNGINRNLVSRGFTNNTKPTLTFASEVEGILSTTVKVGDLVNFIPNFSDPDLGDSMSAILWDFDFGLPLDETSPTIVFTKTGDFRVTALAWDQAGRGSLAEQLITVLPVHSGIAGDFDGDADVDGADFLVWQRDPNVGNLVAWQTNYGPSTASSSASLLVPEPLGMTLLIVNLLCGLRCRLLMATSRRKMLLECRGNSKWASRAQL